MVYLPSMFISARPIRSSLPPFPFPYIELAPAKPCHAIADQQPRIRICRRNTELLGRDTNHAALTAGSFAAEPELDFRNALTFSRRRRSRSSVAVRAEERAVWVCGGGEG